MSAPPASVPPITESGHAGAAVQSAASMHTSHMAANAENALVRINAKAKSKKRRSDGDKDLRTVFVGNVSLGVKKTVTSSISVFISSSLGALCINFLYKLTLTLSMVLWSCSFNWCLS